MGGKFQPGNPGGPGRPRRRTEEQYLNVTISSVTLADWREIVRKAKEQAKRGDSKARDFLAKYLLGNPMQEVEIRGPNDGPIPVTVVNYRVGIAETEE